MCGIAGLYSFAGPPVEARRLERMAQLLAHRGPDDQGIWVSPEPGRVGMAHRRLSIIDLSAAGHQPMHIEGLTLCYNGEIFNYLELRAELETRGHRFQSDCDSEVLVRAYLEWGPDCLTRFNGMWAFALYDPRHQQLFCARDRFGVKPFYYAVREGEFRFASEPKALLGDDPALRRYNPKALGRFLSEGLIDDEEETFYAEILPLPAAHHLVVNGEGQLKLSRYWNLDPSLQLDPALEKAALAMDTAPSWDSLRRTPLSFATGPLELERDPAFFTAVEAFQALLADAVRLRLRSDVPVGTCLSGGLDSSSIMCIASSLITQSMLSFSSIYEEPGCNEKAFIETVVEGCRTRAHRITPTPEDLPRVFDKIAWHQDEPTAGPGLYSQWKVMQVAQGKVTVLLDGQGGDEVLAGYHPYFEDYLFTRAATCDRRSLAEEAAAISSLTGRDYSDVLARARHHYRWPRFLRNLKRPRAGKIKPPAYVSADFRDQFARIDARRAAPAALFEEKLNQRLYHDITRTSIPGLLRYEDRNSMAYGLEARTPFLDYRLVEFCFALPAVYKIYKSQTKRILRRAMAGHIPQEVLHRQDKLGYPTPAAQWFRGSLRSWVEDTLRSPEFAATGLFQTEPVLAVLKAHDAGEDRSWELWRFLATLSWHRQFIQGQGFNSMKTQE